MMISIAVLPFPHLFLFDMFHAGCQDGADMVIVKCVEHGLPFPAAGDQSGVLQDAQLMADRGLAQAEDRCDVSYAELIGI